jgi:CubicO group peptidase (beta-lactamase class C family)
MSADRTVSTATGTFDRSAAGRGPTDEQHGEPVRQRLEPAVEVLRHSAGNDPDRHAFPGAVAGVAHRGRVVLCEAIGSCSAERGAPSMTTDAVFDAASLTKVVVTTTAVLRLVERGSVALDDAIAWHIPELTGTPAGRASVAQLLTHTAGVPWLPFYAEGVDWGGWLAAIAQTLPVVDPGTRVHYSSGVSSRSQPARRSPSSPPARSSPRSRWWTPSSYRSPIRSLRDWWNDS